MPNKIAIIAAVALVVVGAVAYLGLSRAPTQEQQEQGGQGMREEEPVTILPETPSETDTSEWKVYRNEKYGFEVRYPGSLSVYIEPGKSAVSFYDPELVEISPVTGIRFRLGEIYVQHDRSFPIPFLAERMVQSALPKREEILVGGKYKGRIARSPGTILVTFNVGRDVFSIGILYLHKLKAEDRVRFEEILLGIIRSFRKI